MEDLEYMSELNHFRNILTLVNKLLYKLCEKWKYIIDKIQEEKNHMFKFDDLVKFVTKQARVASNPIYGNTKDTNPANKGRTDNYHYKWWSVLHVLQP